ncbi:hypothetical protein STCU_12039 [Strigomonas culicis]|uniref:Uncharacterized protein n=1 Tax=Strigomonas culicis TaxID=28005 RepID=S9TGD1_9TRYP|nr:hypothetical protein STCU_12039 [Strigomonas culicis]|eukprot:EPY15418.1 hypothetical protein STCU_12039 [Strigomonas culicis]
MSFSQFGIRLLKENYASFFDFIKGQHSPSSQHLRTAMRVPRPAMFSFLLRSIIHQECSDAHANAAERKIWRQKAVALLPSIEYSIDHYNRHPLQHNGHRPSSSTLALQQLAAICYAGHDVRTGDRIAFDLLATVMRENQNNVKISPSAEVCLCCSFPRLVFSIVFTDSDEKQGHPTGSGGHYSRVESKVLFYMIHKLRVELDTEEGKKENDKNCSKNEKAVRRVLTIVFLLMVRCSAANSKDGPYHAILSDAQWQFLLAFENEQAVHHNNSSGASPARQIDTSAFNAFLS